MGEGVKKSVRFFFTSFRRKPESSFFKALAIDWTPVFTGVTAEIQFFHTFGEGQGGGDVGDYSPVSLCKMGYDNLLNMLAGCA